MRRVRQRIAAEEWKNKILSAYLAVLIDEKKSIRVPKELIGKVIGHYSAEVKSIGDDYLITVKNESCGKAYEKE